MKKNFIKSYFKSFGIIPSIVILAALFVVAYFFYIRQNMVSDTITDIGIGALMVGLVGLAGIGISKLLTKEVNFLDFGRGVGFCGSLMLAIIALCNGYHTKHALVFFIAAGVLLVEIVVRFIFVDDQKEYTSFRYYFAAIANKYNPLLILLAGALVALIGTILAANNITGSINVLKELLNFKYMLVGGLFAVLVLVLIPALIVDPSEKYGANIFDFVLSVGFVASLYLFVLAMNEVGVFYARLIILTCALCAAGLLVRAVSYTKGKNYKYTEHKVRSYFSDVYQKYDSSLWIFIGAILVVVFGVAASYASGSTAFTKIFGVKLQTFSTVLNYISIVGVVALIALMFVFRNFKSEKIERVDSLLISSLLASSLIIPYFIMLLAIGGGFAALASNVSLLILFIFITILFIVSAVIQTIRLMSYDPLLEIREENAKREQEKALKETQKAEETKEEAEKIQEEETQDDAFVYDDDDVNDILNDNSEEVEETVEEAVEEPVEKTVEKPVEETVEEATEEANEEEAEDSDELEEDEEDETDEVEEAEDSDELEEDEAVEVSNDITKNIQVQEYVAVDENGAPKKIKKRFNTKMMFAPYETKEYYNEVKNYLMMYRAKGRISARCETFRYKGLVAKVSLGGKTLKVYLALDPELVSQYPKYHFRDCSEKKQYSEVPVMIKVRSARGLKYFKELVDMMMANREVKPKRKFEPTNYMSSLIPNGEAILGSLGLSQDYLQNLMSAEMIPAEMPTDLEHFLPSIQSEPLEDEEVEATVYLDTLCNHFEDGEVVDIDTLKSKHVVTKGNVIHIKARGTMDRKLTIYAEYFDEDALQILLCLSCTVVKVYH